MISSEIGYSVQLGSRIIAESALFLGLSALEPSLDEVKMGVYQMLTRLGYNHNWPANMALVDFAWRRAYSGRPEAALVRQIMHASALDTFQRAAQEGWTFEQPVIGSIGILKNGASELGHAFLVLDSFSDSVGTIEFKNDKTLKSARKVLYKPTTGWHLIGFIHPLTYV